MQRYFVDTKEDIFTLSNDDSYHITKVMRNKIGDKVEVVIDKELYICEIVSLDKQVSVKKLEKIEQDSELPCYVTIAQSLVKEQKMDLILQKSCELGVSEIIPINTTRSVVKLDKKETKKVDRWNKILKEASEQSKRIVIPKINEILDIKDLANLDYDIKILCTVNELSTSIKKVLSKDLNGAKIILVIGPEGGFTDKEEELLINSGYISTSFGNRVLRTETASLYALSIINYILMR
ncbi:MAG: 16S rRNA (uracil(1498)-N(3))-methyltransferase [Firmicutes bacterium]|nr:16S rRNA (uracil(1498)-N(3))-methyltransferase [Bacillota bacterium]